MRHTITHNHDETTTEHRQREPRTINSRGQGNTGENYQKQDWQWDIGENNKATRKAGKQEWEVKHRQCKATRDYQNKTGKTKTDHDSWGSVFVPLPTSEFHSGHLKQKKCFFFKWHKTSLSVHFGPIILSNTSTKQWKAYTSNYKLT